MDLRCACFDQKSHQRINWSDEKALVHGNPTPMPSVLCFWKQKQDCNYREPQSIVYSEDENHFSFCQKEKITFLNYIFMIIVCVWVGVRGIDSGKIVQHVIYMQIFCWDGKIIEKSPFFFCIAVLIFLDNSQSLKCIILSWKNSGKVRKKKKPKVPTRRVDECDDGDSTICIIYIGRCLNTFIGPKVWSGCNFVVLLNGNCTPI